MWINSANQFYIGDCAPGDRAATDQEVTDWNAARERERLDAMSVTRRQFKLALLAIGLLDAAEQAIAESSYRALQISYADALDFQRQNPMVLAMASALGKSGGDIDALFVLAATL